MRLLLAWMLACAPPGEAVDHEDARYVMGTVAVVRASAPDPALAAAATEAAHGVFACVDSLMSTWRDDSALTALNRAPAGTWVPVGHETATVLESARRFHTDTGGAFEPTVLPLVVLWGFRGGEPAAPSPAALDSCLALIGADGLQVDQPGGRARLLRPGMAVDLGGVAKGYALTEAARAMRAAGATTGLLDLGGGLLAFGPGPRRVAMIDPRDGTGVALEVPWLHAAVATSGQYERRVVIDGEVHGHVLDPRTGRPCPPGLSVMVQADDGATADALATAALVLGAELGRELLERSAGVEGVLVAVEADGGLDITATSGLAGHLER